MLLHVLCFRYLFYSAFSKSFGSPYLGSNIPSYTTLHPKCKVSWYKTINYSLYGLFDNMLHRLTTLKPCCSNSELLRISPQNHKTIKSEQKPLYKWNVVVSWLTKVLMPGSRSKSFLFISKRINVTANIQFKEHKVNENVHTCKPMCFPTFDNKFTWIG